jgi:uncharacterized protein (DUF2062 family)
MFSLRRLKYHLNRLLRALGKASGSSHHVALGVAVGFFIGWLPIVGIQMVVAIIVCGIVRANKVVPIFPIWLTNPATVIPVYSFNYWVGWKIVGGPPLEDLVVVLQKMIRHHDPDPGMGRWEMWWMGIRQALGELLSMGWEMQLPLWLGCVIVGLALAVPSYYITYRLVESFRKAVVDKKVERNTRIMKRRTDTRVDAAGRPMSGEDEFKA